MKWKFSSVGRRVECGLAYLDGQLVFEGVDDVAVGGIGFFGGECGGRVAVGERVGEGFAILRKFFAGGIGEDVEDFGGLQEWGVDVGEKRGEFRIGKTAGQFECDVTGDGGEAGQFSEARVLADGGAKGVEVEFGGQERELQIEFACASGMDLPEAADGLIVDEDIGGEDEGGS